MLSPDQYLFEYYIQTLIGQGAFGKVWLAYDTVLERHVAIKELSSGARSDEVAFKRFLQEARAAGNLDSPQIVTVYTLEVQDPHAYLVTEYLAGGNLRNLLEIQGPLPVEWAVQIARDVCEGLAVAHAKGIVHRDIKPENVLLTEDGRAKVGDFGIAHVPRGAGGTSVTQAGFQPGTLAYMSPEQIEGQQVQGRSDVYQVGTVLYEMLTAQHYLKVKMIERRARAAAGSSPVTFQSKLLQLLSDAICRQRPENICRLRPDVPEWLGSLMDAMLSKRPEQRPRSEELSSMLTAKGGGVLRQGWLTEAEHAPRAREHLRRGLACQQRGQLEGAVSEFQAAVRVSPRFFDAQWNLGRAYAALGFWNEAMISLQQAVRINPQSAEAHGDLASVYYWQGLTTAAEAEATIAFELGSGRVQGFSGGGTEHSHVCGPSLDVSGSPASKQRDRGGADEDLVTLVCVGLSRDSGVLCDTELTLDLSEAPAGYECPNCGTLYIVDPIAGTQDNDADLGILGIGDHRIEICHSGHVRAMRGEPEVYRDFLERKVGDRERVCVAEGRRLRR